MSSDEGCRGGMVEVVGRGGVMEEVGRGGMMGELGRGGMVEEGMVEKVGSDEGSQEWSSIHLYPVISNNS